MATPTTKKLLIKILTFLIYAIIFLFPLGQLTTIPLGLFGVDSNIHLYLQDILTVLLWLVLLYYWFESKEKLTSLPLIKPIILFITIGILSLFVNSPRFSLPEIALSSLYLIRWVGYTSILYSVIIIAKTYPTSRLRLYYGLGIAIFVTSVLGIVQYFLYPDLRNLYYLGWDPHYLRIFGTFFDPGFLGLLLVLGLDLIYFKLHKKKSAGSIVMSIIIYVALALTYSRSSYLSYGVSIIYLLLNMKKWKLSILLLMIGLGTYLVLPNSYPSEGVKLGRSASSEARISNWNQSVELITKFPILGIGFNTLRYTISQNLQQFNNQTIQSHSAGGLDNSFLFIAVTTGITGLLAYLYLLLSIYRLGDNLVTVSLLAISVHGLFNNSLFYPWVMTWLWLIIGLCTVNAQRKIGA